MSWFADTALDGIIGGVIGGGASGAAVWLTLRAERIRYEGARKDDESRRLAVVARRLRHAATLRDGSYALEWFDWSIDMTTFTASIQKDESHLSSLLEVSMQTIGEAGAGSVDADGKLEVANMQLLLSALMNAEKLLARRTGIPDYFKDMEDQVRENLEQAIREGAFI